MHSSEGASNAHEQLDDLLHEEWHSNNNQSSGGMEEASLARIRWMAEQPPWEMACEMACATAEAPLPPWHIAFAAASANASLADPPSASLGTSSV